jgi:hypothetical protein
MQKNLRKLSSFVVIFGLLHDDQVLDRRSASDIFGCLTFILRGTRDAVETSTEKVGEI